MGCGCVCGVNFGLGGGAELCEGVKGGWFAVAPCPAFHVAVMHFVAPCPHYGGFPLAVFQVVIAPIDPAWAERLAGAGLLRIVAATRADLAHQCAQAAVSLHLHLEARFQEHIEAAYAVAGERDAIGLCAAIGEL